MKKFFNSGTDIFYVMQPLFEKFNWNNFEKKTHKTWTEMLNKYS